ncbi:MAG: KamA family radical SAM protein [Kiritimatiellales bacterium]
MSKNVQITSYYQMLLDSLGPEHPLRRTVEPLDDCTPASGELVDPLGEEAHSLCPGLIHTYPDKVLLLATLDCAVHCQYCTRGRLVGKSSKPWKIPDETFQYLEDHTEIRDVLVSGGDPLMLPDDELDELFSKLRKKTASPDAVSSKVRTIKHIRTVRLGSKVPAVLPSRITPELAVILAKHRVWLQLHVIHPAELTDEMTCALDTLADAGVPMVSQTVLLKGINDDTDILADLFYGLLERRVKPYYLFQCDPVTGSSSFRTPVEKGLHLIRELQGRVSGLALPHFCIDAPGGGGKITLLPNTPIRRNGDEIVLTNYAGKEYRYPDSKR